MLLFLCVWQHLFVILFVCVAMFVYYIVCVCSNACLSHEDGLKYSKSG